MPFVNVAQKLRRFWIKFRSIVLTLWVRIVKWIKSRSRRFWIIFGISTLVLLIIVGALIYFLTKEEIINDFDYSRGVLTINTDKSQYLPGEPVMFMMGSLDSTGKPLCKSNLEIEISIPNKKEKKILKLSQNEIISTSTCSEENMVTNEPDYVARSSFQDPGEYKVILKNADTGKKVRTTFTVIATEPQFKIERSGASRLNSFEARRYPMVIKITQREYFKGQFVEYIPKNFELIWIGNARVTETDRYKVLTWDLTLEKGASTELRYEYLGSKTAPEFIKYGLAEFISNNNVIFKEDHSWQILSAKNFDTN